MPRSSAEERNDQLQLAKIGNRLWDRASTKFRSVHDLFRKIDADGDGKINLEEFKEGLKRTGFYINDRDCETIYGLIDKNGDREIDYAEFSLLFQPTTNNFTSGRLQMHAYVRSKSDVGDFQADPHVEHLERVPPREADYLRWRVQDKLAVRDKRAQIASELLHAFKFVDPRKDGYITYDEFRAALAHGAPGTPGLNIGLSEDQIEKLISICDSDRDGCITLKEFVNALTKVDMNGNDIITDSRNDLVQRLRHRIEASKHSETASQQLAADKLTVTTSVGRSEQRSHATSPAHLTDMALEKVRQKVRLPQKLRQNLSLYSNAMGQLDKSAFRKALRGMSVVMNDHDYEDVWNSLDSVHDDRVDVAAFCDAVFENEQSFATPLCDPQTRLQKSQTFGRFTRSNRGYHFRGKRPPSLVTTKSVKRPQTAPDYSGCSSTPGRPRFRSSSSLSPQNQLRRARSAAAVLTPPISPVRRSDEKRPMSMRDKRDTMRRSRIFLPSDAPLEYTRQASDAALMTTQAIMEDLNTKAPTAANRFEHTPPTGLHMTRGITQPVPHCDSSIAESKRFLTTTGNSAQVAAQLRAPDVNLKKKRLMKYTRGLELQQAFRKRREARRRISGAVDTGNIRTLARSKLKYINDMMALEERGPCRRPGKQLWDRSIQPGATPQHNPNPHPW